MSFIKDIAVQNISKLVTYVSSSVTPHDLQSSPSTSSSECFSRGSEDDSEVLDKISTSSGITAETYLTLAEEVLTSCSIEELEGAITHCKELVLETPEDSTDRKWLVRRLIELRLRLQEIKESKDDTSYEQNIVLLGHHFAYQHHPTSTSKHYCDRCSGIIWNVIHSWYLCTDCEYKCHVKCLPQVCRVCVHIVVTENPKFITDICPEAETGLASQSYRCAECLTQTSFRDGVLLPRLCDYNGKYYCPTCHWNSTSVIPARIIQNWDFEEKRVCRASKQTLKLMSKLPILKLEELNPVLFASVDELIQVKMLRQKLQPIKRYLTTCKQALELKLLRQMGERRHFIENEDYYSLQDLIDLKTGELINYLNSIDGLFTKHIKTECKICSLQGYCCEICSSETVIFPFDANVVVCEICQTVFHNSCWFLKNENCPKCDRKKARSRRNSEKTNSVDNIL